VYWNCGKPGHKRHEYALPKEASTGPLPIPGGGRGLSPEPKVPEGKAMGAIDASW
jgi:hypothetical protein